MKKLLIILAIFLVSASVVFAADNNLMLTTGISYVFEKASGEDAEAETSNGLDLTASLWFKGTDSFLYGPELNLRRMYKSESIEVNPMFVCEYFSNINESKFWYFFGGGIGVVARYNDSYEKDWKFLGCMEAFGGLQYNFSDTISAYLEGQASFALGKDFNRFDLAPVAGVSFVF